VVVENAIVLNSGSQSPKVVDAGQQEKLTGTASTVVQMKKNQTVIVNGQVNVFISRI
jgi:hypothetical protein